MSKIGNKMTLPGLKAGVRPKAEIRKALTGRKYLMTQPTRLLSGLDQAGHRIRKGAGTRARTWPTSCMSCFFILFLFNLESKVTSTVWNVEQG